MYRRSKFLEVLHRIREDMSREADYDVDLFAEMARSGKKSNVVFRQSGNNLKSDSDIQEAAINDHEH